MKIIKGNLITLALSGEFHVIVHGANCYTTFGAGIAKSIKDVFREAYAADCATRKGDYKKLGTFTFADYKDRNLVVINAYTQFKYWKDEDEDPSDPLVDYDAVRKVFKAIKTKYGNKNLKFGIPKIGAGLALGDWGTIASIIDTEMAGEDITLVLFE